VSTPTAPKEGGFSPVLAFMAVAIACVVIVFGIAVWDMTHEPENVGGHAPPATSTP